MKGWKKMSGLVITVLICFISDNQQERYRNLVLKSTESCEMEGWKEMSGLVISV